MVVKVKDITTITLNAHSASSVGSLVTWSSTATTILISIFKIITPPTILLKLANPTTATPPKCKLCLHHPILIMKLGFFIPMQHIIYLKVLALSQMFNHIRK